MSVHYRIVQAESEGTALKVSLEMENRSKAVWRKKDGFQVGTQYIDPQTHIYVDDGPWTALKDDVAPLQTTSVELRMEFPRLEAAHQIYVSPLVAEDGWTYWQGWPLLVLDVRVEQGKARLAGSRVLTLRRLRAEEFVDAAVKVFLLPLLTLWKHRALIRSLVWRDILGRYRGSLAGLFWTVLNPLLLMLTYFFVFGVVLRTRFDGDPSRAGYVLYFLAGMLPWLPFSEAAGRAPSVLAEHRNFVKKVVFPLEILPVSLTAAGLVTQAFALAVFLGLALLVKGTLPPALPLLPALLIPQVLFTMGICWFLSALGAYVRDLAQVNGFLLTLWFFLTPICYPESSLSPEALAILSKNPLFVLVRGYRAILLAPEKALSWGAIWKLWLLSVAVLLFGYAWFHKLKKSFADVI